MIWARREHDSRRRIAVGQNPAGGKGCVGSMNLNVVPEGTRRLGKSQLHELLLTRSAGHDAMIAR